MASGDLTCKLDEGTVNDLMKKMNRLSQLEKDAIVAQGVKEGLSVIVAEGKKNLSMRNGQNTGNLKKSIKTQVVKKDMKGWGGFKRPEGAHAHIIDRGTKERQTRKGENRGKVNGSMFWTDAFQEKKDEAQNIFERSIIETINRIIK